MRSLFLVSILAMATMSISGCDDQSGDGVFSDLLSAIGDSIGDDHVDGDQTEIYGDPNTTTNTNNVSFGAPSSGHCLAFCFSSATYTVSVPNTQGSGNISTGSISQEGSISIGSGSSSSNPILGNDPILSGPGVISVVPVGGSIVSRDNDEAEGGIGRQAIVNLLASRFGRDDIWRISRLQSMLNCSEILHREASNLSSKKLTLLTGALLAGPLYVNPDGGGADVGYSAALDHLYSALYAGASADDPSLFQPLQAAVAATPLFYKGKPVSEVLGDISADELARTAVCSLSNNINLELRKRFPILGLEGSSLSPR